MAKLGAIVSNQEMGTQSASDGDLAGQTIATVSILGNTVPVGASNQTAIDNIVSDINDLKAKLRAAGLLAP